MAHTPGPWQAEDVAGAGIEIKAALPFHPYGGTWKLTEGATFAFFRMTPRSGNVSFSVNAKGEIWAKLCYEEWVQFPSAEWGAMQAANARLIAAAPDLLTACEAALERLAHSQPPAGGRTAKVVKQINAALAAARA